MLSLIRRTVIFLFLASLVALFIYFNLTRPRVLVLHSYQTDYAWTRDVNVGINRVFRKHSNYAVRWHYMDTKNHPWPDFKRAAGITARTVIEDYRPDVVIAIDDDAQELAARHFVGHPSIKVVFAGVNGDVGLYGYDGAPNVTGILERKPLHAVRDTLLEIAKTQGLTQPRVVHIGDSSGSVKHDDQDMQNENWKPLQFFGSRLVSTWPQWQEAVREAQRGADFIIVSNYRRLSRSAEDKTLLPYGEVMPWTEEHSTIPVVGTNGFNVEDGAGLAVGTSPYEQGEVAAQMTVDIIDRDISPAAIPHARTQQFTVSIREVGVLNKHLHLPAVYEAFARATDSFIPAPSEIHQALLAERQASRGTRLADNTLTVAMTSVDQEEDAQSPPAMPVEAPPDVPPAPVIVVEVPPAPSVASVDQAAAPLSVAEPPPGVEAERAEGGGLDTGAVLPVLALAASAAPPPVVPVTPARLPETAEAVAPAGHRLEWQAQGTTGVRVSDAAGKTLLDVRLKKGESAVLEAVSLPLKVQVDSTRAVTLTIDGRPYPLKKRTERIKAPPAD